MSNSVLDDYNACYEYLSSVYSEVNGEDFYRYLFPNNENSGEYYSDFSHPNAIYLYRDECDVDSPRRLRRRIMLNDTWADDFIFFVEGNEMTLCSGLTYHSRCNKLQYAQNMNALIFDLDGVGYSELRTIFLRMRFDGSVIRSIPTPTFIVLSGRGLHLYYVFNEPIALYPNIKVQLKALKYDLTFRIWDYKSTSKVESIQYQSIGQGFRMVGSLNNKYGNTVTAFQIGDRVSLEYLNSYVNYPENQVDITRPYRPSKVNRAVAAELYPEWYQRVVVEGNKGSKKWNIGYRKKKKTKDYALYEWWKRKAGTIRGGHRYYFLMCLVIYACKCDVPKEQLEVDMQECFEILKEIDHDNVLTKADVDSAMECYSKDYYNFTIADIELLTDVRIERNKRNGQKQADHLEEARAIRDIRQRRKGTDWRDGNGRPSKHSVVYTWQLSHPGESKAACARDTGLDPKTIRKWWDVPMLASEAPDDVPLPVYFMGSDEPVYMTKAEVDEWNYAHCWHKELPDYYVIEGEPDMIAKLKDYSEQGIRNVQVLSPAEYEYLCKVKNKSN